MMLSPFTRKESYLNIRRHLEQQVLQMPSGEALPPIRALIKAYGVGQGRLEKILKEMIHDGLVEHQPRKGLFRARENNISTMASYIDLVVCGSLTDIRTQYFGSELIQEFTRQVTLRNQGLRLHQFWRNDSLAKYESLLSRSDIRGVIVFGIYLNELGLLFEKYRLPWVSIFPRIPYSAKAIIADDPDMPKLQLTHLWSLGHKRIAYLDQVDPRALNLTLFFRRESYYRLMAERGLKVEPQWVMPLGNSESETIASFEAMFSKPPYPTALIVGDSQISTAYRFLESRGLKVPRDVSVIGTDDLPFTSTLHPSGTTIHNSRDKAVSMALEDLDGLLMGKEVPQQQYVPLSLVVRESTGPVREEK